MADEPTNIMARDKAGRFAKGTKAGGRLPRVREEAYLKITVANCSEEQWGAVVAKAVEQALKGNAKAREWLARYLLPRPAPASSAPLFNLNFGSSGSPMPTTDDIDRAIEQRIRQIFGQEQNVIDVTPAREENP